MLPPADADLIRRETALPGLATLLDPEAFVAALEEALPDGDLRSARIKYVRYKPGTSCLVGYQLKVGKTPVDVHAWAYRPEAYDKLAKARAKPGVPGVLGPGRMVLEDRAITVAVFPNDRELKALARLADDRTRRSLLRELLPDRPELWGSTVHKLNYKPERRYVGQLLGRDGAQAALKLHGQWDYEAAQRSAGAFASRGDLRLARRLGASDLHRAVAVEWLPGRVLSEALKGPELDPRVAVGVGAALAALHAQDPEELACPTRDEESATLLALADWLSHLCPQLATRARELAQRIGTRLVQKPAVCLPIHGDFYAKQVLIDDGRVALLDLDQAHRGDPAADLGLFIAHLERDVIRGKISPGAVAPLRDALLEGYQAATRSALPPGIELYTAAGLLSLTPIPFRSREPDWPERIEAALERAEECERHPSS